MNVLVTGGAGFVGSHVVDRLVGAGHSVVVVDDLSAGRRENVNAAAILRVCDIRTPELRRVMDDVRPQAVVHLAAQAAVPRSVTEPQFDASVNILGTINLLEAAQAVGVARLVYVSTGGAAYGDTPVLPTPEDHPARAISPYGVSKVTAERYLECWTSLTSMTCTGRDSSRRARRAWWRSSRSGCSGASAVASTATASRRATTCT
jgi:UDP-glucose 4-epimerase